MRKYKLTSVKNQNDTISNLSTRYVITSRSLAAYKFTVGLRKPCHSDRRAVSCRYVTTLKSKISSEGKEKEPEAKSVGWWRIYSFPTKDRGKDGGRINT